MPWLDKVLNKNPIRLLWPPSTSPIVKFANARAKERQEATEDYEKNNRDFLSRFIEAKARDDQAPDWAITAWTTSNVLAGSDTTAILLRTIFYHLLKYPSTLQQLLMELQQAAGDDRPPDIVGWHEAQKLPFLDACIKEAGRLHPPFGLPLERIVPAEGASFCGEHLPGGTIVGINAWVAHSDQAIFGQDADTWRPGRWLCDGEERKQMERSLLTVGMCQFQTQLLIDCEKFGAGHRSCIGKNISYLEIYKLVPTLLWRYEMELTDRNRDWHIENFWFVVQTGFKVSLKRRNKDATG
ncbi:MAG: hypothetical protein Q9167_004842 [Letrouitia subvulpina]